ncbi:LysR family transcriptional regulator [Marinomonas sp. C2222]|uniref:LysR family transcriptional regulator n=1 Tax=Marinomonas sargassi TaxID=2984494 RepID=A0ABT2YUK4_9GAMM|nr:LysR family transcriptional regulator [Marinomonas sargassi]MCV2403556.1 LysR family transcriptional regulator [Marinomonas sargassi]
MRNLNNLATFVQVAKHESVTKAASRLYLTQQAVSHQIKKLEEELGVVLFKRANRKIHLTPEGRSLLVTAEKHLSALEEEMIKVKGQSGALVGSLSIACTMELATLLLAPAIEKFKKSHPQVHIDIALQDDAITVNNVVNGKTDIGMVVFSSGHRLLDICPFRTEAFITVASHQFIATHGAVTDFGQVVDLDIIDYQMDCPSMKTWLGKNDKKQIKRLEVKTASIAANDDRLIKDFVMAGLGIANLPRMLVEKELASGEVIEILPNSKSISAGIDLVTMKDRVLPAHVSAFLEHLKSSG